MAKTVFRKIPAKKGKEKKNTDTIEVKSTSQGKIHNIGKYGREGKGKEVHWRKDLERACATGFGREVQDKKIQERKEVHGIKG